MFREYLQKNVIASGCNFYNWNWTIKDSKPKFVFHIYKTKMYLSEISYYAWSKPTDDQKYRKWENMNRKSMGTYSMVASNLVFLISDISSMNHEYVIFNKWLEHGEKKAKAIYSIMELNTLSTFLLTIMIDLYILR